MEQVLFSGSFFLPCDSPVEVQLLHFVKSIHNCRNQRKEFRQPRDVPKESDHPVKGYVEQGSVLGRVVEDITLP